MPNLDAIKAPLQRVQARFGVPVRVIGAGDAAIEGVRIEVRQWSPATEVSDLADCSIGLVPLPDQPWNHWKFFFKTIQYMAVGLPVIAQRMGSNSEVIQDGVNGFLVETGDEWAARLSELIEDPRRRAQMGAAARATVTERFSLQVQQRLVASVFNTLPH
jgi:glycosyltransferase involved in cell wall biosynthesis